MKFEYQDDIDDYLLNRMSEDKRRLFEQELNGNQELREQFDFTNNSVSAIISRNEKLAALKEWEKDYVWKDERHRNIQLYWISGVAALLVVSFFVLIRPNMKSDLSTPNAVEYELIPFDGNKIKNGSDFSEIESMIDHNLYNEALEFIEIEIQSLIRDSIEISSRFVFNYEEYQNKLHIIRDKQDDLLWLKVKAFLGLNNSSQALKIIDVLRQKEGKYQIAADSLYNQLIRMK